MFFQRLKCLFRSHKVVVDREKMGLEEKAVALACGESLSIQDSCFMNVQRCVCCGMEFDRNFVNDSKINY